MNELYAVLRMLICLLLAGGISPKRYKKVASICSQSELAMDYFLVHIEPQVAFHYDSFFDVRDAAIEDWYWTDVVNIKKVIDAIEKRYPLVPIISDANQSLRYQDKECPIKVCTCGNTVSVASSRLTVHRNHCHMCGYF